MTRMSDTAARRLDIDQSDFERAFEELIAAKREPPVELDDAVAEIIASVRQKGDQAVADYTARFDRLSLTPAQFRFTDEEIESAKADCTPKVLEALRLAGKRIEAFHRRQLPENEQYTDDQGVVLGHRWTPIAAVGLYVPGGTASYPSSVLMNAIPARIAGVRRLVMTVPTPEGEINPLVLAAADLAGVSEIYRLGGAQAVAALAYGTGAVEPVDKIVGPGNAYVAAAKRQVFGRVGIDTIAGPSEILIVADGRNDPSWIAADLLSQAEHDDSSQSILITDDGEFAERVIAMIDSHLATLDRAAIARASWETHGAVITVRDLAQAVKLADRIAPEHLEIATEAPRSFAAQVSNAGAIFLGRYTPEAIGDYVAGPNHVLPTARSARYASGLSVLDFVKRTSIVQCDADALRAIGESAVALADAEGLGAHARSVSLRLNR